MKRCWEEIKRLIAVNARHRSGVLMGEVSNDVILQHAWDEFSELSASPRDATELADLLGVLFHYAIKQGWTMERLEQLMLDKFALRFDSPASPPAAPPPSEETDPHDYQSVPLKVVGELRLTNVPRADVLAVLRPFAEYGRDLPGYYKDGDSGPCTYFSGVSEKWVLSPTIGDCRAAAALYDRLTKEKPHARTT